MFRPMKPETIARLSTERRIEQKKCRADLRQRLTQAAKKQGPDSIYHEILNEIS